MTEVIAVRIDPTNTDQARAWDGDEGAYWADNAERFDRSVAGYHRPFMAAARVSPSDRVLDIGCGTGQTTRDAARSAGAGTALGVDLSARMVAYARELATHEGVANAAFEQADAQVQPFTPESFDVAISRTGAMFFGNPVVALTNVARALRPDGRLVLLTWQALPANEWIRELSGALSAGRDLPMPPPGAPGPFALSDPDRVRTILTTSGFRDIELAPRSEPMWFGDDQDDAHRFVVGLLGWMLHDLDDDGRSRALDQLRSSLAAHESSEGVLYGSAAWTITATRA